MAAKKIGFHPLILCSTLLLAALLNFYAIRQEGFGNLYYAATVRSMMQSASNFFFASFDPGGFVSVDKPPLGFWVQTIFARLLGYQAWVLMLPQALAGVLSVFVLYRMVRRPFGPAAGLLAALALAIAPVNVAANRNNTIDSQLILVCLLAAWAASRAAAQGKLRWLLLSALLLGLGFNIKMLQAYLVLPACFGVYLLGTSAQRYDWLKRSFHLLLAGLLLLVVSLSWAVAVDLVPPENRPYVGSSQDNTVLELIIGHNGLKRLLPGGLRALTNPGPAQRPMPPAGAPVPPGQPLPGTQPGQQVQPVQPGQPAPPGLPGQPGQAPVGGNQPFSQEIGQPGLLRLFSEQLAGQASWLLGIVAFGALAAAWQARWRLPLLPAQRELLLWLLWVLPQLIFFSVANLFHRYYLAMLSPGIAALFGLGMVALWQDYRKPGLRGWLLPLALPIGASVQVLILLRYEGWSRTLAWIMLAAALAAGLLLAVLRILPLTRPQPGSPDGQPATPAKARWAQQGALALGLAALLLTSAAWSLTPLLFGGDTALPYAGPELARGQGPQNVQSPRLYRSAQLPLNQGLVRYLLSHHQGERWAVAGVRSGEVAPFIIATGEAAMAMGGFSGSDPILDVAELQALIQSGQVRYFISTQNMPGAQPGIQPGRLPQALPGNPGGQVLPQQAPIQEGTAQLLIWVRQTCRFVPRQEWSPAGMAQVELFDCKNAKYR